MFNKPRSAMNSRGSTATGHSSTICVSVSVPASALTVCCTNVPDPVASTVTKPGGTSNSAVTPAMNGSAHEPPASGLDVIFAPPIGALSWMASTMTVPWLASCDAPQRLANDASVVVVVISTVTPVSSALSGPGGHANVSMNALPNASR